MRIQLTPEETRVLGALIEKEITTPDQYPLSLNGLTVACNQKSNREPVVNWDDAKVREIVDGLVKKRLVRETSGHGSRVVKFKHWFCNTEFGDLKLTAQELGIICVLFLRGPQTPGELRTRTNRLCEFSDVSQVEAVLNQLIRRDDGPFVVKHPREPGKRESRYAHLFCSTACSTAVNAVDRRDAEDGEQESALGSNAETVSVATREAAEEDASHGGPAASLFAEQQNSYEKRISQLERQVVTLHNEMKLLKDKLGDLLD